MLKKLLIFALILGLVGLGLVWFVAWRGNTEAPEGGYSLTIPRGSDYEFVKQKLVDDKVVQNEWSFDLIAGLKKYDELVKPGHYLIPSGMTNIDLVNKLRSGDQDPITLQFRSYRRPQQLAEGLAEKLDFSAQEMMALLDNPGFLAEHGFNKESIMSMFLPNTYEVYWTETPEEIFARLKRNYDEFWTEERRQKAAALNLNPLKVSTLASIVQEETAVPEERPTVAGLYLNRLRRGIPLQADPTVKFALGNDTIRRILYADLEVESPYNTYKIQGLPPGPINNPQLSSLEAVLQPEEHDYIFMVARCPLDGRHNFSKTNAEHERYAAEYRKCLKKLNIRR